MRLTGQTSWSVWELYKILPLTYLEVHSIVFLIEDDAYEIQQRVGWSEHGRSRSLRIGARSQLWLPNHQAPQRRSRRPVHVAGRHRLSHPSQAREGKARPRPMAAS